jgi:hypothetical protein
MRAGWSKNITRLQNGSYPDENHVLSDILVQFVFGFPAGVISLSPSALGIWKKWIIWLVIAGILTVPFTFYLTAASGLPLYLNRMVLKKNKVLRFYPKKGDHHVCQELS